jgi:hypothetical protein
VTDSPDEPINRSASRVPVQRVASLRAGSSNDRSDMDASVADLSLCDGVSDGMGQRSPIPSIETFNLASFENDALLVTLHAEV